MPQHPELQETAIDVGDLIQTVAGINQAELGKANLMLVLHLPGKLPLLSADEHQLRQVLTNLIENAIKFTPADGHIEISVEFHRAGEAYRSVW